MSAIKVAATCAILLLVLGAFTHKENPSDNYKVVVGALFLLDITILVGSVLWAIWL